MNRSSAIGGNPLFDQDCLCGGDRHVALWQNCHKVDLDMAPWRPISGLFRRRGHFGEAVFFAHDPDPQRDPGAADQQQRIGNLSGGERTRVHLAKVLRAGGNLLLLDEPTNDLDVETLRALEEALLEFPGCAVVISHDRWFLDRIATHMLAFEGNSEVVFFEGNYAEYEADLKRRKGEEAAQPHRLRYRKVI
jgi:ABC-type glutathione transport system ATPase component